MLSDKYHLYELVDMSHRESLKDDEEICKLNHELMTTHYSLRSTQSSLFDSNLDIEKLHQELKRSHIFSYTSISPSHMVDCILGSKEEPHVMVVHEEHADLKMFEEDREFEFPFGASHTFMEYFEKYTIVKPTSGGVHVSTCLVDESCRGLVHSSSPYNFI